MTARATCWRWASWTLWSCLAAGCVVVDEQPVPSGPLVATPVAIPFRAEGAGAAQPGDVYYDSVVTQLQQAWLDRDRAHLARLLDLHDRSDAPAWAQERMRAFRRVLSVMEFETVVQDGGKLELPEPLPALGEPLRLAVRLGPLPGVRVRLPGGDDPARARFVLVFRMRDHDCFGTELSNSSNVVVDLPQAIDFGAGQTLDLPLAVDVADAGSIRREVEFEVFWMPGHVEIDGQRQPNRRVRCAHGACELLPRGHEQVVAQPLAVLRTALRLGDALHFAHVYLAARRLASAGSVEDRQAATAALVDRVRLGSAAQARNAMAALAELQPDALPAGADRAGWLQWWAQQAPHGRLR